jgi:hypothetical protein
MKELRAVPKPQRVRSKALTDSAKGRACTLRWFGTCDPPETVVFCHVRINSGLATKPPDFFGFYGCAKCHRLQERSSGSIDSAVLRAICETQYLMAIDGLLTVKGWKP